MNRNIFVLDTSAVVCNPNILSDIKNSELIIHFCSFYELDNLKKEKNGVGHNARSFIRRLEDICNNNFSLAANGIPLENGSIFKVYRESECEGSNLSGSCDDKIISLCMEIKRSVNSNVILVSNDINMKLRASCFGINSSSEGLISSPKDVSYTGWKKFEYPSGDIKYNSDRLLNKIVSENSFLENEFVVLNSCHKDEYHKIFRFVKGQFIEVNIDSSKLWGIEYKNYQQKMALDLLLDDSIKLVTLWGPSGTGKTFLVLLSMFYKIVCKNIYQKLLISRPLIPLSADIGFLPGDLNEKLQTWMQPVKDNLDYLLYRINPQESGFCLPNGDFKHRKKKKGKKQWDSEDHFYMDTLTGPYGQISFEAITYMRGRSIPDQVIFIDEAQNLTSHEVKTIISRAGVGTKVILTGDPYQIDSPLLTLTNNGLMAATKSFKGQEIYGNVNLQISERSELSALANELM
jgi:PhoH-like ATPase